MTQKEIIDSLKPICLCKGIRKKVFLKHVSKGIKTVKELQNATGAGDGSCEGKRCTPRIESMLGKNGD
jgi:bacterioferritin-associated ferredoxin